MIMHCINLLIPCDTTLQYSFLAVCYTFEQLNQLENKLVNPNRQMFTECILTTTAAIYIILQCCASELILCTTQDSTEPRSVVATAERQYSYSMVYRNYIHGGGL